MAVNFLIGNTNIRGYEKALNKEIVNFIKGVLIDRFYALSDDKRAKLTLMDLYNSDDVLSSLKSHLDGMRIRVPGKE